MPQLIHASDSIDAFACNEDLFLWPCGSWCFRSELAEYNDKSDNDYLEIRGEAASRVMFAIHCNADAAHIYNLLALPTSGTTCYQCGTTTAWLAPDSRCGRCTNWTPEEIRGETPYRDD